MAAMFQAQTANWEETQEKMSQSVSPLGGFCQRSSLMSNEHCFVFFALPFCLACSATRIYTNPRGTGFARGGKPHTHSPHQQAQHQHSDRPLPPSYVCYRCGQKGLHVVQINVAPLIFSKGHWIQDCPTNNDREFDNRPRIKRTTGIPRSMLKAVENPNSGELGQGVMVTPEGGYVVAQPDLYVPSTHFSFLTLTFCIARLGKNRYRVPRG